MKILTIFTAALLSLSLVACTKKEEAKPNEAPAAVAPTPAPAEAPKADESKQEEKK